LHPFANFGLMAGSNDLQMCEMFMGFPSCLAKQNRVGTTKFFLQQVLI